LSKKKYLYHLDREEYIKDSIYQIHYTEHESNEPHFEYFSKVHKLNIRFDKLFEIMMYARNQGYSVKETERFVANNFDNEILDHFSNDEWLISKSYRQVIGTFINYRMIADKKMDKGLLDRADYVLDKITKLFSGKTRE